MWTQSGCIKGGTVPLRGGVAQHTPNTRSACSPLPSWGADRQLPRSVECRGWEGAGGFGSQATSAVRGRSHRMAGSVGRGNHPFVSSTSQRRVGRGAVSTWPVAEGLSGRQETGEAVVTPALTEEVEGLASSEPRKNWNRAGGARDSGRAAQGERPRRPGTPARWVCVQMTTSQGRGLCGPGGGAPGLTEGEQGRKSVFYFIVTE